MLLGLAPNVRAGLTVLKQQSQIKARNIHVVTKCYTWPGIVYWAEKVTASLSILAHVAHIRLHASGADAEVRVRVHAMMHVECTA